MRGAAATAVVLFHFHDKHFGPDWITRYFPSNGHGFVIVFFVISGFLITMAAENKSAAEFTIDRCARIAIVALPVLLACFALSALVPTITAAPEYIKAVEQPVLTLLLNATFLSQSWSLMYFPYLDAPFWSLSYEVMYYLIFGLFFYLKGPARWILSILLCAAAGPKILVLFPCWLAGVAAFKFRNGFGVGAAAGWVAVIGAPLLLIVAFKLGLKGHLNAASLYFDHTPSEGFVRSWAVAATVAVHLWGVCQVEIKLPRFVEVACRHLANMSYSIYLAHLPFLYLLAYYLIDQTSALFVIAGIPLTFCFCFTVSALTERNTKVLRDALNSFNLKVSPYSR